MTKEELKATAQELIDVLKLKENEEPILLTEDTDLENFIKEAIALIEPQDKFTEETLAVIAEFKKPKAKEKHKKPLEVVADGIPDIPDLPPAISMIDEIRNAERLKDLKEIAVTEDQFKKIRGILSGFKTVDELRNTMLAILERKEPVSTEPIQVIEETPVGDVVVPLKDQNTDLTPKEAIVDIPDESELIGRGTMAIALIHTRKPFKSLFNINPKVLQEISNNIRENGFDTAFPLILWKDVVIDGHTRLEAATFNGLTEVPVLQKEFASEEEALEYAIHNQRARRNLTDAELLSCIEAVDKKMTKAEAGAKGGASNLETKNAKTEPTHKVTAEKVGVSESKVSDARTVLTDEKAVEEVKTGKKSISAAAKEIREKKSKKEKVVKEVLLAGAWLEENKYPENVEDWATWKIISQVMMEYAVYYHKNIK